MKTYISKNQKETIKLGERLGRLLSEGNIVALTGQLGAGKTTFIKGVAKGLGVKGSKYVNSPSFVIVKEYKGRLPLYHFDVYRLEDPLALDTVGYQEYFYGKGATMIEWADKIKQLLPEEYLELALSLKGPDEREIKAFAHGAKYEKILGRLRL